MARLGTESAFQVLARAEALRRAGRSVINLGIGQPDFPTAPHIVEAACRALRDGHHGYTDAQGILALREAVSTYLAESTGAEVDPGRVLITPGGKVAMFFAMLILGEAGAEILYPDPGFPIYASAIAFSGARPRPYALHESEGFSFRAEEILQAIRPNTRLLILNSPGNPTGGVAKFREVEALVSGLDAHPQIAVLSDEIYRRLAYQGAEPASLLGFESLRDRLIVLDGWSKTYAMTGWRLGFSIWPDALIEPATRLAINDHSCVNAAAQYAGIAALEGPQDAVDQMVAAFDTRRRAVTDALNQVSGLRCTTPRGAFYCFPNISETGYQARVLQDALLEKAGVATVAGTSFGGAGEGFLRISYATELDAALEAIARIQNFLDSGGSSQRIG
jgi:aspartate/methionine/tyrosine aminotransferase